MLSLDEVLTSVLCIAHPLLYEPKGLTEIRSDTEPMHLFNQVESAIIEGLNQEFGLDIPTDDVDESASFVDEVYSEIGNGTLGNLAGVIHRELVRRDQEE